MYSTGTLYSSLYYSDVIILGRPPDGVNSPSFSELAINTVQSISSVLEPNARGGPLDHRDRIAFVINFYQGKSPAADVIKGVDPKVD